MATERNLPLWLRPWDFRKSGTTELHDTSDGSVSAYLRLDSQKNLSYDMTSMIDHAVRKAFADDQMWQTQREYFQNKFQNYFGDTQDAPGWFGVIRNRIGFQDRVTVSGDKPYLNPTDEVGPPHFISPAREAAEQGVHFGFIDGLKVPIEDLKVIIQHRERRITIASSGRQYSSRGNAVYVAPPDWPVEGELSIPAIKSSIAVDNPKLMRTISFVLAKMVPVVIREVPTAFVFQKIYTFWSSTGHTVAGAEDGPRTLEMYLHFYPEEYRLLRRIIDDEDNPDIIADAQIL